MTEQPGIVLVVPELCDELVRLRPWRATDAGDLVNAWHDRSIVAGSSPPDDRSPAGAARWIEGWDERRTAGVAFDLVVADPVDDRVVGEVGLYRFDVGRRAALIGWWVAAPERGRGVATRAVGMLVGWALGESRLDAVMAEIALDNDTSMRVAARCGFEVLRVATADHPAVLARRQVAG